MVVEEGHDADMHQNKERVPFFDTGGTLRRAKGWNGKGSQPGDIDELERCWVDRQVAIKQAGYMLLSRYRPGWRPSWSDMDWH